MTNATAPNAPSIVLITGTSSGVGLHAAVAAARAGQTVVATMRNLEGSRALLDAADAAEVSLDIRRLDVTAAQSVSEVVAEVVGRHGRLDAVVNNACSGHVGTIENETIDQVRAVMEVSFFGVVALARVAGAAGVSVTVVEAGAMASSFVTNVGFDPAAPAAVGDPYAVGLAAYLARAGSSFASAQTAESAGSAVAALLDGGEPPCRVQTSDAARGFVGVKLADLDGAAVQRPPRPALLSPDQAAAVLAGRCRRRGPVTLRRTGRRRRAGSAAATPAHRHPPGLPRRGSRRSPPARRAPGSCPRPFG